MNRRRLSSHDPQSGDRDAQLSLAIEPSAGRVPASPATRTVLRARRVKRAVNLDPILWMRDVVDLTGKHRCTIHRWIHGGNFPKKDAPKEHPTGWLRSTIERWLLGTPHVSRRDGHE